MGKKPNSCNLILGVACFAICAAAYQFGFKAAATTVAVAKEATPSASVSEVSRRERTEWANFPDLSESMATQTIVEANALSDIFQTHYISLYVARRIDDQTLANTILACADLSGNQAHIIQIILLLELAQRDPLLLASLLNKEEPLLIPYNSIYAAFQYWAKEFPEIAFNSAVSLNQVARKAAIDGIRSSGNSTAARLISSYKDRQTPIELARKKAELLSQLDSGIQLDQYPSFIQAVLEAYQSAPAEGFKLLSEVKDVKLRESIITQLVRGRWDSPIQGMQSLTGLYKNGLTSKTAQHFQQLSYLLYTSDDSNVGSTLSWLDQNLSRHEKAQLFSNNYGRANFDPIQMITSDLFRNIPMSPNKTNIESRLLNHWAKEDFDQALNYALSKAGASKSNNAITTIISIAQEKGYQEKVDQLYSLLDTNSSRQKSIANLAESWGQNDPLSFIEWVSSKSDPTAVDTAVSRIANSWVEQDLDAVRTFEGLLPDGQAKRALQRGITDRLTNTNPIDAIEYASGIADKNLSQQLITYATIAWGSLEPRAALDFADTALSDSSGMQSEATRTIAWRWAENDPDAATRFFADRLNDEVNTNALQSSLQSWIQVDALSALEFASNLPPSTQTDRVLLNVVSNQFLATINQEEVIRIIAKIQDEQIRNQAIDLVSHWAEREPQF